MAGMPAKTRTACMFPVMTNVPVLLLLPPPPPTAQVHARTASRAATYGLLDHEPQVAVKVSVGHGERVVGVVRYCGCGVRKGVPHDDRRERPFGGQAGQRRPGMAAGSEGRSAWMLRKVPAGVPWAAGAPEREMAATR